MVVFELVLYDKIPFLSGSLYVNTLARVFNIKNTIPQSKLLRYTIQINVMTTFKYKSHNHNDYVLLYKESEQWLNNLDRFLECQKCNILVVS